VSGIAELAHHLSRNRELSRDTADRRIYIVDAETQDDLNSLCDNIDDIGQFLWVGTVGLLTALAGRIGRQYPKHERRDNAALRRPADPNISLCNSKTIIVVVGSLNPASRNQLDVLRQTENVAVVILDSSSTTRDPQRAVMEATSRFDAECHQQDIVAVTTDGQKVKDSPDNISRAIARVTSHLVTTCGARDLVITGGDTALKVLQHLGFRSIELIGEFDLGMPVAKYGTTGGHILTKAGGFGRHDALVRACDYLRELPKP
jgi:uncharacterized protein YgbK (DUF1537 family)